MPANNRLFTDEQEAFFREHQYGKTAREMADLMKSAFGLELKADQIKTWRHGHGLKSGTSGQFKKGAAPPNKGKKRIFHSKEAEKTVVQNQFPPGHMPASTAPLGTRRLLHDGYIWVKYNDVPKPKSKLVNWRQEHILLWEKANGAIPAGHVIVHINGNKADNRLENLRCIPNAWSAGCAGNGQTALKSTNRCCSLPRSAHRSIEGRERPISGKEMMPKNEKKDLSSLPEFRSTQ